MKKRSFFLLELLIGMVILTLTLPLLIRQPIYFLQSEIRNLQDIEYERIKDLSLWEIKKTLYENPSLLKKLDPQQKYPLPPIELFDDSSFHRNLFRYFFLSFATPKEEKNTPASKLLKIDLVFEDPLKKKRKEKSKKYTFFLFVEKKGKNS